jgi:hypothetical protein
LNVEEALPNLSGPGGGPTGHLAPELIRTIVRDQYAGVRRCYQSGLARHPQLAGRITLRFAIEVSGKTSKVTVSDNELADCVAVECVRAVFGQLEFPPPEGGSVIVQYPLTLEPG